MKPDCVFSKAGAGGGGLLFLAAALLFKNSIILLQKQSANNESHCRILWLFRELFSDSNISE